MDEERPKRRRNLTAKEKRNLEKQRQREQEIARKQARMDAKYREEARKQARKKGMDSHIVVQIPARPQAPPQKRRKKTIPDIIERETDKRVRNLSPTDHKDGYYVNEVEVRKEQAQKQKRKRRKSQPKPVSPKKRRVRRILTYTGIIAAVMIIGVILSLTVLFKTENIVVKGNEFYEDNTIIELAGVTDGENIFMATIFGNTDAVSDSLPYIKTAKVGFQVPNTLVITVTNEKPYYTIKSNGKFFLIGEDGRILEQVDKRPKNIMFVEAPPLESENVGDYVKYKKDNVTSAMDEISESLVNNNYSDITGINVKHISDITLTYDNRIVIKLGLPDDLDYKIRTAFTIINTKLDPNNAGTIKGVLNVSDCNTTKKSYFNEGDLDDSTDETTAPAESTAESTTVRTTYVTNAAENVTAATDAYYNQYSTEAFE